MSHHQHLCTPPVCALLITRVTAVTIKVLRELHGPLMVLRACGLQQRGTHHTALDTHKGMVRCTVTQGYTHGIPHCTRGSPCI
jgi:hypothetical protein